MGQCSSSSEKEAAKLEAQQLRDCQERLHHDHEDGNNNGSLASSSNRMVAPATAVNDQPEGHSVDTASGANLIQEKLRLLIVLPHRNKSEVIKRVDSKRQKEKKRTPSGFRSQFAESPRTRSTPLMQGQLHLLLNVRSSSFCSSVAAL